MDESLIKKSALTKRCIPLIALSVLPFQFSSQAVFAAPKELQEVAPNSEITGHVFDTHGEPVIGASVLIKNTATGTITNFDGAFQLKASEGSTLVISYVGYVTQEVRATPNMRVVLKEDTELLDEVVVVGYGMQKKVNLTGAVTNVNVSDAISTRPVTDVGKALQGVTPGLSITNNNGGLGKESTIKLRGSVGSLNADAGTAPLILVDNVEVPSINMVNPDDIETISVLKDAASASIYGTRAAWGVILITTKQGSKKDKARVTYSNNFAWNKPTKMAEIASAGDNAEFILQVMDRLGISSLSNIGYTIDAQAVEKIKDWESKYGGMSQAQLGEMQEGRDFEILNGKTYFYRSFDAIDEFTKDWTPQQNHNLSINGGNDKTTYNISMGMLQQDGVMTFNCDKYSRYNLNTSLITKIRDWWSVNANVMFTHDKNDQPYRYTSGQYDAWFYLTRWPRWYPYTTYEGKEFRSAVTDIKNGNRESLEHNYVRANLGTEITPIKDLSINFNYTYSLYNTYQKRNGGTVYAYNMFTSSPFSNYDDIYGSTHNRVVQNSRYTMANIFKAYATYNLDVKENNHFKFMAGMDAESRERLGHYSERRGLISQTLPEIALGTGTEYAYDKDISKHDEFSAVGFFARVNYNYLDRYLLEVNARYDGSSKFPTGKKWGFFPSASAGWRVAEEAFMEWSKPALTDLKLRGSWGTIGNQDVAANSFISTMGSGNSGWVVNGMNQLYLNSPSVISKSLTWERVTTYDVGVDARFFNNQLGLTFDWYRRVTSDMHCQGETLPSTFGDKSPKINYGEITGNGFELGIDFNHMFENGMALTVGAGLSHIREKITKYNNTTNDIYGNYEGKILGEIWGYETDRLFQASDFNTDGSLKEGIASQKLYETGSFKFGPGDVKYKDLDGSGEITYGKNTIEDHGDLKRIGNYLPNFEYNFTIGFDYKGFDFRAFFQGVGKRDYWASSNVVIPGGGSSYADASFAHQMDYWTPENTNAFYPRPSNNAWVSNGQNFLRQTRYLLDMSYLRCKNLTLGYSFPTKWMNKIYFQSARLYVSAENLFEFDNLKVPVDPESSEYKEGYGNSAWAFGRSYPYTRTMSFGMQIVF